MNILSESVPDLKDSDYEFNRFDKSDIRGRVSVLKLMVVASSYSNWEEAATPIFNTIAERFLSNGLDIYCFVVSPWWKADTRIVRRNGLGRSLMKDLGIGKLDFLFEREIINDKDVIFYGVVKVSLENARDIFNLLSKNENGILFSSESYNTIEFNSLVEGLAKISDLKTKTSTFKLNVSEAINLILEKGFEAIFPYSWEETGEYNLDIFKCN